MTEEEEKQQMGRPKICPDCGNTDLETKNDERYCKKCGLVID